MIELAPERIAEAGGLGGRARGRGRAARAGRGRLAAGRRRRSVLRAPGGERRRRRVRGRCPRGRSLGRRSRALAMPRGWPTQPPVGCSRAMTRSRRCRPLAREWRRELGCRVVGITGSTGKTSVKDIVHAVLPFRVHASPENFNTEIGPAPRDPGRGPGDRGPGAGDGDARHGADRRAVRDRRARHRRDHERRPGPPGAAGNARGDRGGQGRAAAGARGAGPRDRAGRRRGPRAASGGHAAHAHLRPRWRRARPVVACLGALDRGAGRDPRWASSASCSRFRKPTT